MGTGEKSLLCDPGSELRLLRGGREKKEGEGNKWGGGKKRLSSAFECSYFLLPSPALRPATRAYRDAFTARMTYQIPGTAVGDAQTNPAGTGMTLTAGHRKPGTCIMYVPGIRVPVLGLSENNE